jgi:integrase
VENGVWGATELGTQLSLKSQHLKLNPHTLRHTHGYHIIQAGGHLGDVAESLGTRLDQVFDEICQAGVEESEVLLERA